MYECIVVQHRLKDGDEPILEPPNSPSCSSMTLVIVTGLMIVLRLLPEVHGGYTDRFRNKRMGHYSERSSSVRKGIREMS